jgi:hypothetical protein
MLTVSFRIAHSFPESTTSYIPRPNPEDYLADEPTARRLLVSSLLGSKPHSYLFSPYISPATQLGPVGNFDEFPPTFIHYGDAERLEEEIDSLVRGMKRDGVDVDVEKTPDAVHDVLMARFWNEDVRRQIYMRIAGWCDKLVKQSIEKDRELGLPVIRSRAGSRASVNPPPGLSGRLRAPSGGADLRRVGSSISSVNSTGKLNISPAPSLTPPQGPALKLNTHVGAGSPLSQPIPLSPEETAQLPLPQQLPNGNLKVGPGHPVGSATANGNGNGSGKGRAPTTTTVKEVDEITEA